MNLRPKSKMAAPQTQKENQMKIPQAWNQITAKTAASPKEVNANRINMSEEVAGAGKCPDCQKPMEVLTAGAFETMTCMACRISLPIADPVEATAPSTSNDQ
jgi:hypothetical protein